MLQNVNRERIEDEKKGLQELLETSGKSGSVVFDAGAGSGKTYALVECIKYILIKNFNTLSNHNQRIACITYTNVAANNIKKRIGNSEVVMVSTIHERIWEIIKNQQDVLLELHKGKLENEIQGINDRLEDPSKYKEYMTLSFTEKQEFKDLMLKNKEIFFNSYNFKAGDFKNEIKRIDGFPSSNFPIRNVKDFKDLVRDLFDLDKYEACLKKITDKINEPVSYDSTFNKDRLDKMQISHDTVLEYGKKAIENNPLLKQMVIDKYPYILIDEYQDTDEHVVEIMKMLDDYSKTIKHNLYIAYFGDSAQSIYDKGVGDKLFKIHSGVKPLAKIYNRRSCQEIIDVGNRIRNEENIQQVSIYDDANQGKVKFYNNDEIEKFISKCREELHITEDNKLHCLIPKNSDIARLCSFEKYYNAFRDSSYYSGGNFNLLNDELLSSDINRLGEIQLIMYKMTRLIKVVNDDHEFIHNIEQLSKCSNMSLQELKTLIDDLRSIHGASIKELLESIFDAYNRGGKNLKTIIEGIFGGGANLSLEMIKAYITEKLYRNKEDKIDSLLDVEYEELLNWYNYITEEETSEIVYHTIHGSKGEEYDNVALIIGDHFRRNDNYFKCFFSKYKNTQNDGECKSARNLLYVACTRAKYNLYVLYTDDISDIKENIKEIFRVEINK